MQSENAVTRWFGPQFAQLHPLLQALHRHGGRLSGEVRIERGRGLAGWIGSRLLRKFGLPPDTGRSPFEVEIRHEDQVLHWNRRFGDGALVCSQFRPVGRWPDGYWIEQTGPAMLDLTVDVERGAWRWRCLRVRVAGLRLPLSLFPRATAYKFIDNDKYWFCVKFDLPMLGNVLEYSGALEAQSRDGGPVEQRNPE
jgi:hypothetical protein